MTAEIKTMQKRILLDHEKLIVYQVALEFVILSDEVIKHLPRGRAYLSDQLQRAALSISLNIAEGAAKRSATECAGIFEVCQRLQLIEEWRYIKGRELLVGIVSMLVKMVRKGN